MRKSSLFALAGVSAAIASLVAATGEGVTTRTFVLDSASELSAGVLDRVSVTDDGRVVAGAEITRVAPADNVGSIWSLLDLGDGSVLAGTGVDGRVYRVQNGAATLYAETGAVVVTSLARAEDGTVYAGTLPDGKLFRLVVPANGRPQVPALVATLPGVQHIWAIAWDRARRSVLCATGPDGKLFAVTPQGAASVVFDSDEPHLYSMALRANGEVLLGSGGGHALVFSVRAAGQARVLARLAGNEVRALAVVGDDVAIAANDFADPPEPPRRSSSSARAPSPGGVPAGGLRPGRGSVYWLRSSGLTERVYSASEGHINALEADANRNVWIALGAGGRVISLAPDRSWRVAFDVDEHQVMALDLTGRARMFATGDSGAFYAVAATAPAGATWNSRVLDGGAPARWGSVRWRGNGSMQWSSRSGNSDTPDSTWNAWQDVGSDGVVASTPARYLQVRARLGAGANTEIRAVTVYYLPENQRAVLTEVSARMPETKVGDPRPTVLRLGWKVENPDADALRYRLRFRGDGEQTWRPLLRNQDWLTASSFDWPTEGLPEGYYQVEVEATDDTANPEDTATRDQRASEPVLVDNTPPTVTVRQSGARIAGDVSDGASAVTRVEMSVDAGEWHLLRAQDGVLDERQESFETPVGPAGSASGEHVVSVRAYDEANNVGVGSVRFRNR